MDKNLAQSIVHRIIEDMSDRSGLSSEWDMVDDEIKEEITEAWIKIVSDELAKGLLK